MHTSERLETTLGDLITLFYDEYMALYGDEDLAAVAAAASINELLMDAEPDEATDAAAA